VPAPPIPAVALCAVAFGMAWLCLWRSRWRLLGVPVIATGFAAGAAQRPPDVLVSPDAKLIALRAGDQLFLQRLPGASGLTREVWVRLYGGTATATLPPRAGQAANGTMACDDGACTLRPPLGGPPVVLLRGAPPGEACANGTALVVSAEPVRGRCAARVVDRFSVWRDGAHAAWLEPSGARVLSDRAARGSRPWVPPPPRPRNASARGEAPQQPAPDPE
jgi:competence protein ComEC